IMQCDDARQAGNTADESRDIVIVALHHNTDRQLDVELLSHFRLQGYGFELETAVQAHLGDIFKQARHFGVAGQLLEQGTKALFDFDQLFLVGIQIGSPEGLVRKLLAQRHFLALGTLKISLQILQVKMVAEKQQYHEDKYADDHLQRSRPRPYIVEV